MQAVKKEIVILNEKEWDLLRDALDLLDRCGQDMESEDFSASDGSIFDRCSMANYNLSEFMDKCNVK